MEPGSYIAIGAALVALLGTRLTYRAAMQGLDNQRVLADREAAGEILDATSVEIGEVGDALKALAGLLASGSEDGIRKSRELIAELRKVSRKMELRYERLRIRFRSSVADSYELALNSVLFLLDHENLGALSKVKLRASMGMESSREIDEREANLEEFRAEQLPRITPVLSKAQEDFASARSGFRDAAYEMIGIGPGRGR